ncbi:MAG TPA: non-homologous end-joining DNA ligase [Candidatus Limnocylindria bacterium]|nr:non-homologous end-joining DNA ligase [Candidatus Limnocylindria bacterium]
MASEETRADVALTNLDQPLFDGARATKRDLVEYLDAVRDRILPELADRPLSVIRVHRGQEAFMQKNLPRYTPDWVRRIKLWSESSRRDVEYALCDDRGTLIWFANQRAVEYHPTLVRAKRMETPTHLVIDVDPPDAGAFAMAAQAAHLVRAALAEIGLRGAVKTSGSKGVHVYVPVAGSPSMPDAASATRAIAERTARLDPAIATTAFMKEDRGGKVFIDATRVGWASVISAYSPRVRPGTPISFPVAWDDLDAVEPGEFTVHTALEHLGAGDPWSEQMPPPQRLPRALIEEGVSIPGGRVQAMHEGRRRARAKRDAQ